MTLCFLAVVALATPRSAAPASGAAVPFADVRNIIHNRCLTCHSAFATDDVFGVAPNGVMFDTPEQIVRAAPRIVERAAVLRTMPPANKTEMTDAERDALRRWGAAGARLR